MMQGPFAALSFKSIVYSFTNIINSHLISLNSQRKLLTHKTQHMLGDGGFNTRNTAFYYCSPSSQ